MSQLRCFETSRGTGRRIDEVDPDATTRSEASGRPASGEAAVIECDPTRAYQTIVGFGAAFTESAAWVLAQLDVDRRRELLEACFHPTRGNGYNLCRTHIDSCDFSLEPWSCCATDGDLALESFDLGRTDRWILPLIRAAREVDGAGFRLFASPWSPPAWMKTNGSRLRGGRLRPDCRDAWARHYVRWIRGVEAAGVPVWGLTVQNEPEAVQTWDSCIYSATEERDFVRDHLGPALVEAGLGDRALMVWDHNRDRIWERARVVLGDADAARYVWGMAFHWYSGDEFENLARVHEAFPDKRLVFSEGCWEGGVKLGRWDRGERYAHHVIGDLNHHAVGWVDWNLALDHTGGPNHVGNLCDAPIIVDTGSREVHYQTSYWYLGHFSRFIRAGARRVHVTAATGGLEATAARNPDGSVAVVILNPTEAPREARLRIGALEADIRCPARGIQTWVCGKGGS